MTKVIGFLIRLSDLLGKFFAMKNISRFGLIILTFFLAMSGFVGGFGLILDPSGNSMEMPLSYLENSPFTNYLIPGVILLVVNGILPTLVTFGLLFRPKWKILEKLNLYKNRHWSWTFSLYQSIILILWIDFQIMWVGYGHFIQTFYALIGVAILIFTMLPSVMEFYSGHVPSAMPTIRNVKKIRLMRPV